MKETIINLLSKELKLKKEEIEAIIEIPPNQEMGDFAFPCFILSKTLKKNPVEIALEVSRTLSKKKLNGIDKIENKGPYINFFIDKNILVKEVLSKALNEDYGKQKQAKKILIEHTSINPNASPHVGRSRNSIIGDSIVRILKFLGNKVEIHYYVNDVSKQIAMLALIYKKGDKFSDMLNNYIEITKNLEKNPELEKKIFKLLEQFEAKDKNTVKLFNEIVSICVEGQKEIFDKFNIKFDFFDYESKYIGKPSEDLLKKFEKTGKLFKDKEGRMVLDLSHTPLIRKMKAPMFVLARSNGTGLYGLRDIAYTIDKLDKVKNSTKSRNIIVLGEDQKLYFEEIAESLKLLGYSFPEVVHYSFVLLQTGKGNVKMSTRRGELVLLEDFYRETIKHAESEVKARKTKGDPKKIALAAIKYAMLKNDNDKNIIFSWENSLNFEGDSGPYLQYSYARASSILRKSKSKKSTKYEIPKLNPTEIALIKKINEFPVILEDASNNLNPSIIANYSFQLSQTFNEFYQKNRVIDSEDEVFRLKLVEAFRNTIRNSLYLLGIEV
ncbi:MAG: arginine--tRNA ligase, partial [Nanoarchaeota archaeon]